MSQILRKGDRGEEVTAWCARLRELGHDPGPDTGEFSEAVDKATRAFQTARRIKVDGIVGPVTRASAQTVNREVPRAETPLTEVELRKALADGHRIAFGSDPTPQRLACAWAQCALEHARGKAIYCNNIGNVTGFDPWPGKFYSMRCQERVQKDPDVWKTIEMRFRAHSSPAEGAADYWRVIKRNYSAALLMFDAGDPAGAARKLGAMGYYTAHVDRYAAGMASLYRDAVKLG
jgi:hypothetical protein